MFTHDRIHNFKFTLLFVLLCSSQKLFYLSLFLHRFVFCVGQYHLPLAGDNCSQAKEDALTEVENISLLYMGRGGDTPAPDLYTVEMS